MQIGYRREAHPLQTANDRLKQERQIQKATRETIKLLVSPMIPRFVQRVSQHHTDVEIGTLGKTRNATILNADRATRTTTVPVATRLEFEPVADSHGV